MKIVNSIYKLSENVESSRMDGPRGVRMFKVVLLGEAGVGKSSIFLRLKENVFGESLQPTVGIESCSKVVKIDGQSITVSIKLLLLCT